jgi:hypothetical protein
VAARTVAGSAFPLGEQPLEHRLAGDQVLAETHRTPLHLSDRRRGAGALLGRETELVGEVEDMARPGVAVQLGGKREAHAAAGAQIRDLLRRERLDGPVLPTAVR